MAEMLIINWWWSDEEKCLSFQKHDKQTSRIAKPSSNKYFSCYSEEWSATKHEPWKVRCSMNKWSPVEKTRRRGSADTDLIIKVRLPFIKQSNNTF